MVELNYSMDEIKDFIEQEVPDNQKSVLLDLLSTTDTNKTKFNAIGEELLNEELALTQYMGKEMSFDGETNINSEYNQQKSFWLMLEREVYKLLCNGKKSKPDGDFKDFIIPIIGAIAGKLCLSSLVVTAPVTLLVVAAIKMGINIFCENSKCMLEGAT